MVELNRALAHAAASLALVTFAAACSGSADHVEIGHSSECPSSTSSALTSLTSQEQVGSGLADKTLALTFDDGPAENSGELSDYLKREGVPATFFINGAYVAGREAVVRKQVANGHLIANHTHTHRGMVDLSAADRVSEIARTDALLSTLSPGTSKRFFRPPFGAWNDDVRKSIENSEMSKYIGPIGWDIGAQLTTTAAADWDCWDESNGTRTVEECGDLYLKEIKSKRRGIVLLHDGPPGSGNQTFEMMKYVLPLLEAEGYKFVRVDQVPLRAAAATTTGAQATDPCSAQ